MHPIWTKHLWNMLRNRCWIYILFFCGSVQVLAQADKDNAYIEEKSEDINEIIKDNIDEDQIIEFNEEELDDEDVMYYLIEYDTTFKSKYNTKDFDYTTKQLEIKPSFITKIQNIAGLFKILIYILIAIVVFFLLKFIYELLKEAKFNKNKKVIPLQVDIKEVDAISIENTDFKDLINKAKENNDYRSAVRYYFLLYLQKLATKEIIIWHKDKTNTDYLYEISDMGTKEIFSSLSYPYEWVWYGGSTCDENTFNQIERLFLKNI